ncbi:MAG: type II toxin-antitoxin system RelE/ParE family toxin [Longimicrobiales bacterium]|nr:type II toxin-antitoxin system RelE/ParE family toxin [Longimicrobiales bacterium]
MTAWKIETSEEFDEWWTGLDAETQEELAVVIGLLSQDGPNLPRPYADKLRASRIDLRELRKNVYDRMNRKHVYRVLYAFDPRRNVFVCLGGDKAGHDRWYERNIPRAEAIFARHLESLGADTEDG